MNIQETIEHRVIRSKCVGDSAQKTAHLHHSLSEDLDIKTEYDLEASVDASGPVGSGKSHKSTSKHKDDVSVNIKLLPEFPHVPRTPTLYQCEALEMPRFLYGLSQRVQAVKRNL